MAKLVNIWDRRSRYAAVFLLLLMLALGVASMARDSGIVDEVAHIPAGYSYLKFGDFRLNPEHPPLVKDLAALPLLFMQLDFPADHPSWTSEPNGQWESGWHFIYHYGNNADTILFASRLPILMLAIFLGGVIFVFAKKHFGPRVATLAVFLYALEPNLLAHSRFVTTDLGIAAFNFFALVGIWRWLKKPNKANLLLSAVLFALAQLAKFSALMLIPFLLLIVGIWIVVSKEPPWFWQRVKTFGFGILAIFVLGFSLVWLVYIPHTINMPEPVQDKLIEASLPGGFQKKAGSYLIQYNHLPGVKPFAQYALGALMVFNRVSSGNTTYFLGEVTNQSFVAYFPVNYLIKTPIALLVLVASGLSSGVWLYFKRRPLLVWPKFKNYVREHLIEFTSLAYIAYYSYLSISGNLNLGIRHLLPIMPLVFILVARQAVRLYDYLKTRLAKTLMRISFGGLLLWYLAANLITFPSYVAYFNEFIGGPGSASKYVTDSSVDWGQDLRRLVSYVKAHPEIDQIAVDYFGGGDPRYYFCDRRFDSSNRLIKSRAGYDCSNSPYLEWHAEDGMPGTQYIAVSETFLMNDLYYAPRRGDIGYSYLRDRQPITKIGNSIYVYQLY